VDGGDISHAVIHAIGQKGLIGAAFYMEMSN